MISFIPTTDNNLVNPQYVEELLIPTTMTHTYEDEPHKVYAKFVRSDDGKDFHQLLTNKMPKDLACLVMVNGNKHYTCLAVALSILCPGL